MIKWCEKNYLFFYLVHFIIIKWYSEKKKNQWVIKTSRYTEWDIKKVNHCIFLIFNKLNHLFLFCFVIFHLDLCEMKKKKTMVSPHDIMAKVLDYSLELQSCHYIHFWTNTLKERFEPPYPPPSYTLNSIIVILLQECPLTLK